MSTATLTWTLPTTRVDGSPLATTDIARVDVYDSESPTPAVAIGSVTGPGTTFTTGTLDVGNHGFTVIVVDSTGHSAAPSNVAALTVPAVISTPSPVADLAATLNP